MRTLSLDVKALIVILTVGGIGHFVRPQLFESQIPDMVPLKRQLVYGSGVAEIACAAALVREDTRKLGGWATAALMVVVFPANIQMAVTALNSDRAETWYQVGTLVRLPLQIPLVTIALKAARQRHHGRRQGSRHGKGDRTKPSR